MSEIVQPFAEWCAVLIEVIGIAIIALGTLSALVAALVRLARRHAADPVYEQMRQRLGRGILLGLEFLVAADIIHTVAVELTFETVGVLAIVVAIRTFLSFTLEVELDGHWPWRRPKRAQPPGG